LREKGEVLGVPDVMGPAQTRDKNTEGSAVNVQRISCGEKKRKKRVDTPCVEGELRWERRVERRAAGDVDYEVNACQHGR
jgi:hypothetical protein